MSREHNIAITKRMGEAINKEDLSFLNEVFAPDVVDHDPAPIQGKGPEGFVQLFAHFRTAFPDLKIAIEEMVADEDKVAIACTVTGTQHGPFQGFPATGTRIKARWVQIAKFNREGKIIERWGSSDEAGILKQIGAYRPAGTMNGPAAASAPASFGQI